MHISAGLKVSNWCRKVDGTRPMKQEMDEKLFVSHLSQLFDLKATSKCSFPYYFYHELMCKQVSRQHKGMRKRNEIPPGQNLLTDATNQSINYYPSYWRWEPIVLQFFSNLQ